MPQLVTGLAAAALQGAGVPPEMLAKLQLHAGGETYRLGADLLRQDVGPETLRLLCDQGLELRPVAAELLAATLQRFGLAPEKREGVRAALQDLKPGSAEAVTESASARSSYSGSTYRCSSSHMLAVQNSPYP